jgi:hypothetical protein
LNPEFPHNKACTMDIYEHIHAEFKEPRVTEFPERLPVSLIYVNTTMGFIFGNTWRYREKILTEDHMKVASSLVDTLSIIADNRDLND